MSTLFERLPVDILGEIQSYIWRPPHSNDVFEVQDIAASWTCLRRHLNLDMVRTFEPEVSDLEHDPTLWLADWETLSPILKMYQTVQIDSGFGQTHFYSKKFKPFLASMEGLEFVLHHLSSRRVELGRMFQNAILELFDDKEILRRFGNKASQCLQLWKTGKLTSFLNKFDIDELIRDFDLSHFELDLSFSGDGVSEFCHKLVHESKATRDTLHMLRVKALHHNCLQQLMEIFTHHRRFDQKKFYRYREQWKYVPYRLQFNPGETWFVVKAAWITWYSDRDFVDDWD